MTMFKKITIAGSTAAALSLQLVQPIFAQVEKGPSIVISPPAGFKITEIGKLIQAGYGFLLIVAGLLAFAFLILGGIQWITSGGDKAGLEGARNKIIHAIVGLIVVFSAWAITLLVQQFIGYTILGNIQIPTPFNQE